MLDLRQVQARPDTRLRNKLDADAHVSRARKRLDEDRAGYGLGFRHSLLASGLRLTRGMGPTVADALNECKGRLGVDAPVEVFVTRDEGVNAFCTRAVGGPMIVGLSSTLLDTFTDAELRFVVGHELAHAAFDHFAIPMPAIGRVEDLAGRIVPRAVLLELFVWSRAAELSADRAGLLCVGDVDAAASAFFKTATGITSGRVRFDAQAFGAQTDSLSTAPLAFRDGREEDYHLNCFSTHPYSPLRVRALIAFGQSVPFRELTGKGPGTLSADELEAGVEADLKRMDPSYLEERTPRSALLRRVLFHAGMAVAWADGEVHLKEREGLRLLLGRDVTTEPTSLAHARELVDQDIAELNRQVPRADRVQLVQHLAVIALADGQTHDAEVAELHRVAALLEVDPFVADQTLRTAALPLD